MYLFIRSGKETGKALLMQHLRHKVAEDAGAYLWHITAYYLKKENVGGMKEKDLKYGMRMKSR